MPIPMAGGTLAVTVLFFHHMHAGGRETSGVLFVLLTYLLSFLMVSTVRYRSFKQLETKPHRAFYLMVSVIILISLDRDPPADLAVLPGRPVPALRAGRTGGHVPAEPLPRPPGPSRPRPGRDPPAPPQGGAAAVSRRILIFDTTLRDGEQSPGFSMNNTEKVTLARQLARLGVDVIEAGFPVASEGDFEAVSAHRPRDQGPRDRGPGAGGPRRHRPLLGRGAPRRPAAHPHLHRHQRHPHPEEVQHHARGDPQARGGGGPARPLAHRRRGVLRRGRLPLGLGVPLHRRRGRDRRRGDHDQHPRHRRVRDPLGVRRAHPHHPRAGAEHRAGGALGPLPRRPRARRREFPGRRPERRRPGRVHGERHRRARGQREPRGDRDGAQDPPGPLRRDDRHPRRGDHPHQPPAGRHHRDRRPAEQGDRREKRVRPRVRDPPGRRAQGRAHLRDHDPGVGRPLASSSSCSGSTRAGTPSQNASRSWATS